MPIGKNSIKRVKNNGYSQVKTSAPDMEHSTVIASPAPEVMVLVAPEAPKSAKKTEKTALMSKKDASAKPVKTAEKSGDVKKALPKKPAERKSAPKKTESAAADKAAAKSIENEQKNYINLGGTPLPVHLL